MLFILKNHPFAVATYFECSLVLTYAIPKEQLQHMIPPCLSLDTFDDKWAFLAVAMVKTRALRPKGFPEFMGNDFILTGYRIFVRYTTSEGKRLRGLYIIRSETDKRKMSFFGNIFTHYNYTTTDVSFLQKDAMIEVSSIHSGLHVVVNTEPNSALPDGSPFKDWKEARRFAGPLPFTFTFNKATNEVLIIEGVREYWEPKGVSVIQNDVAFIDKMQLPGMVPANAFVLHDIPYYWKKGKINKWKG